MQDDYMVLTEAFNNADSTSLSMKINDKHKFFDKNQHDILPCTTIKLKSNKDFEAINQLKFKATQT